MKTSSLKEGDYVPVCNCLPDMGRNHLVYKNDEGTCPFCKYYVTSIYISESDILRFTEQSTYYYRSALSFNEGISNKGVLLEDAYFKPIRNKRKRR